MTSNDGKTQAESGDASSDSTEKTLYLIDGTAYIYRAYHAIRSLSNSKGLPTNAVFGFTRMVMKLMEERSPEYVAMFFDAKGPTFRHEMYDAYKANRPPAPEDMVMQLPYIKKISAGFNLPVFELPGFEADDLIGTIAIQAEQAGFNVVMVTGDKDFMQLVSDKITIWDPMKDKRIDCETIRAEFGIEPRQFIDVLGLAGDTADNVPGVPGVGPKTAIALVKTHRNMERLYEEIDTITKKKQKEKLLLFKDQALLSRQLVTIDTQAPVRFEADQCRVEAPDRSRLARLFKELEFRQLQQAFPEVTDHSQKSYTAITDTEALSVLIRKLESAPQFALDTETTSKDPMLAELVGFSFALTPHEAFYIPCAHEYEGVPEQLSLSQVLERLKPVLGNPEVKKIGQNIKYDWMVLSRHGVQLAGVAFDTMLASYLLNPTKRAHNLDQIALDFLNHKTITYEEVAGKGKSAKGFKAVDLEKAVPYACEDADLTLMARDVLQPELEKLSLTDLMQQVEMPLVPVLMGMEMQGVCVDTSRLRDLSAAFEQELESLEQKVYALAGEEFNLRSPQQLGYILFEKMELPVQKKTRKKTGYSTDVNVLTALAAQHELPALVLRHRTLAKLKSTYADALLAMIHPQTGRIHTSFNQTVAATGRLSSSEPNLQNIPVRTDEGRMIRSAFVPRKGWHFLSADYSQIELRILAHCSDDAILIEAFQKDEDIHTRTASEVFQTFPTMIDAELRRQAKAINFGIIYGMGPFSLSKELGVSLKMARTYIESYFRRYSGVKAFINQSIESARDTGRSSTLLGRIRMLPEINSSNGNVRGFAERIAVNTPIQGTAADLIKLAMIKVDEKLKRQKMRSAMLLSVHDEIIFEVPPDELQEMEQLVCTVMEGVWALKVPLKVNVALGTNWAEAH
jgi:DNA polymerase I